MRFLQNLLVITLALASFQVPSLAAPQDVDNLSKMTNNPISSLISVPLQGNFDFGKGPRDESSSLLNFQPVIPFEMTPSTNIILRVIVPLASQPTPSGMRISGLGDTTATAFLSPTKEGGRFTWGAGPVALLPTASNAALGTEKIGFGPSFVLVSEPGHWTLGILANQIWSVDGATSRDAVNQAFFQPFAVYRLGSGASISANVEAVAQWEAGQKWTVPLHFTVSKVALLGKRPVNFQVGAGPYLASPDGGPHWRFRVAASFLFPR